MGTALAVGLDKIVTGIELNVNHLRAVKQGHVTVTAEPLHVGRTTAVWDMKVHDDDGRLVAVSRLTLAVREPPPASYQVIHLTGTLVNVGTVLAGTIVGDAPGRTTPTSGSGSSSWTRSA